MRKPSTPIKVKTKRYSPNTPKLPKPTVRPKPTGPDYEGPYSIKGTAGPVNETVSKVRDIINRPSSPIPYQEKGGAMKKLGCAQCGKSMQKGGEKKMKLAGTKKMDAGGNTYGAKVREISNKFFPMSGPTGPNYQGIDTMKKGGAKKSFPDMSGDGKVTAKDILMAKGVIKKPKAKFGATVKVQRSPKAGKVRSAGDQGYAAVGQREPGRVIKKTLSKKAAGGPIIDKLKAKLAERKVTKAIKKSVKSSGKIVK